MDRQSTKRTLLLPKAIILIFKIFFILPVICDDDGEWVNSCLRCRCHHSSGMKAAYCTNLSLYSIPKHLSQELGMIDLSHNSIAEIKRYEFSDANLANLHKIFLKNCTLVQLSRDAFYGLDVLIELDLSNNLLRQIDPTTFSGLKKLRKLLLNNNELKYLPTGLFENSESLSIVDFRQNQIVRIDPGAFRNLSNLISLDLTFNNLRTLNINCFVNASKVLGGISLEHNPWNCTCYLREFRNYVKHYTALTSCSDPPSLRGKIWGEIDEDKFACRPRILHSSENGEYDEITKAIADNVTLTCQIHAAPKPNIMWLYNKRVIKLNDPRYNVVNTLDVIPNDKSMNAYTSELTIYNVRLADTGQYTCVAENAAGQESIEIQLKAVNGPFNKTIATASPFDLNFLIICAIILALFTLIIVALIFWFCCCRQKQYSKDVSISENRLMTSKLDKSQNGSLFDGSVMRDARKSLLTVNPVEKPPRRGTEVESEDADDGTEIEKTLLSEKDIVNNDEEANSIALSDTTPRSRQAFIDCGLGTSLPPDLLSFQAKAMPQSPSMQSSISHLPDNRHYGKSALANPLYQHVNPIVDLPNDGIYGNNPNAFRTLQHPKNRNLALLNNTRSTNASPFLPAPIVYPPVVMKQGYMTIPRKPRIPSWTPSCSTNFSEFQPMSSQINTDLESSLCTSEPVYDNLGVRTTASGNSALNLTKIGLSGQNSPQNFSYTMKDRPLPATPKTMINATTTNGKSKIYEPIQEDGNYTLTPDIESLYGSASKNRNYDVQMIVANGANKTAEGQEKLSKIPPRPPPKPKKKSIATPAQDYSIRTRFEDEGVDGTEV